MVEGLDGGSHVAQLAHLLSSFVHHVGEVYWGLVVIDPRVDVVLDRGLFESLFDLSLELHQLLVHLRYGLFRLFFAPRGVQD